MLRVGDRVPGGVRTREAVSGALVISPRRMNRPDDEIADAVTVEVRACAQSQAQLCIVELTVDADRGLGGRRERPPA